ncbi:MAG: ANTAR domain-containing protein [Alphaproteobacteria bacterium]|mgnify:FL=1
MNEAPLIVLLIDSDEERARTVEDGLQGAAVVKQASAVHGTELLAIIRDLQPDAIIIDCDSPDRDTIENLQLVARENPKPIVMFVEDGDGALAKEAVRAGVTSYIVDGLSESRIKPVIEIAIERFKMVDSLRKDLEKSRADLEARKTIERAKGMLMQKRDMSENDAYAAMRNMAMKQGKTIKDVAENILSVMSLLE